MSEENEQKTVNPAETTDTTAKALSEAAEEVKETVSAAVEEITE